MEKDLRLAFLGKEKAELFLSNLEKLRSDNSVNEGSYNALKNEYTAALQHAMIRIEHLKAEFNKTLSNRNRELGIYKQELANLEARFKVGQISAADYLRTSKPPEKKITVLEDQISHLTSLINAVHSAQVTVPETAGFGNLFGMRQASARPAQVMAPPVMAQPEPPPLPPPPPPEPVKEPDPTCVVSLMILPDRAFPGSTIGVIATIVNNGPVPLLHRTEMKVNDRVETATDVNLNPGQNEEVTFMTVAGAPGDYYVSVDNAQGILKVIPPA